MIIGYLNKSPKLHESVYVAEGAQVIGDVTAGRDASIWFNAVVRGDVNSITIGERTNIQDNTVVHVTYRKFSTTIGSDVTIGHSAVVHGCTIEDLCLIGMGAILLDGCVVGSRSIIAAGTLVREGFHVPPGSLVAGVPGKIVRQLTEDEVTRLKLSAEHYVEYVSNYRKLP